MPCPKKRKLDPEPRDLTVKCEALIRAVPEIDGLLEVCLYLKYTDYLKATHLLHDLPNIDTIGPKQIVRRGKKNKATNIFIYGD